VPVLASCPLAGQREGPFACSPVRDRLSIKRLREMMDAAARVHRGAGRGSFAPAWRMRATATE
jgi:hypothetical protein